MRSQASRHDAAPRTQAPPSSDRAVPPAAPALGSARLALPPRGLRRLSQVFFRRSSGEGVVPSGGPSGAAAAPRAALQLAPPDARHAGVRAAAPRGHADAWPRPAAFGDATPMAGAHDPTPVPDAPQRGGSPPTTPAHRAGRGSPALDDSQQTFVEPSRGEDRGPGPSARRLSNFTYAQQEARCRGLDRENADAHAVARGVLQSPIHLREGTSAELAWALPPPGALRTLFHAEHLPAYVGDAPLTVGLGDCPRIFSLPDVWDEDEDATEPAGEAACDSDALLRTLASPLQLGATRSGYFSGAADAGPRTTPPTTPQWRASAASPASSNGSSLGGEGAMRFDARRPS